MVLDHVRDRLQIGRGHDGPRRVVREVDDERLRARRHPLHQPVGVEPEPVARGARHRDRDAPREGHARGVADVARLGHEHLVARVRDRPDRDIEPLRDPGRDDHLGLGVVAEPEVACEVVRDPVAERGHAPVRGVRGAPLLERVHAGVDRLPRGREVGFADPEADHAVHGLDKVEEPPDPGGRDRPGRPRDVVAHAPPRTRTAAALRPRRARGGACRSPCRTS